MDAVCSDERDLSATIAWLKRRKSTKTVTERRLAQRPISVPGLNGPRRKGANTRQKVPCPRCGKPMQWQSVMCKECFIKTRKERGVGVW